MTPQDPQSYVGFIFLFDLFAKSRCWIFSHLSKVIVYFKAFTPGSFVIPPSASCRFPPFCHLTTQRIACHCTLPFVFIFKSNRCLVSSSRCAPRITEPGQRNGAQAHPTNFLVFP